MATTLSHFAVNADDLESTRAFYEGAFGWSFREYTPGFIRAELPEGQVCAIQQRRQLGTNALHGFECTLTVDDVEAFAQRAQEHGGRLVMERSTIPGVGDIVFVEDPSGNVFGAIERT
jgi:predicted enzyme related to lactoylglutathione lyase